jgi:hypothetical protein
MSIKDECITIAVENLPKNCGIHPTNQIEYIFAHAATNKDFGKVIVSEDKRVQAELKAQIKYICSLGLDAAKGKKLVYVKTRNINVGDQNQKVWLTFPDISESYHALILILIRSKVLKNIVVQHTYSGYTVEYSGKVDDVPVVKSWATTPAERGEYTGCFVTLYLPDGAIQTSYHHAADINATHKQFSKSGNTWKNHELAMTAKSAIMDSLRYVPKVDEVVQAVVEHYDENQDYENPENTLSKEKISDYDVEWLNKAIIDNGVDEKQFDEYLKRNRIESRKDITVDLFIELKKIVAKKGVDKPVESVE